jgi:hypothetical protein
MGEYSKERFVTVIGKERTCPKFTEWQQGYSPRDHADMEHERQLREWQEARMKEDRLWREQQDAQNRAFQERLQSETQRIQVAEGSRNRTINVWCAIMAAIVVMAAALIPAVLAYLKENK